MGQRSNYAALKDAQLMLGREEYAIDIGRNRMFEAICQKRNVSQTSCDAIERNDEPL